MRVHLVNSKNQHIKEIKWGVSWVYLIFGGWALLFGGRFIYIVIEAILNILAAVSAGTLAPLTVVYHIFLFLFGNKVYARYLLHRGWEPADNADKMVMKR